MKTRLHIGETLFLLILVASTQACGGSDTPSGGEPSGSGTGGSPSSGTGPKFSVGNPCIAPDELDPAFSGFDMTEYSISPPSADCSAGSVCLQYHFQGRASCPHGQAAPTPCAGPGDTSCPSGECVPACAPDTADCGTFVCHVPGDCQLAIDVDYPMNDGACCVPGTDTPVSTAVCGQCDLLSYRSAFHAVFCSCRCGLADGAPDTGAPLCSCPMGFECAEIKPYLQPGDEDTAGKYCIHEDTAYTADSMCGKVDGYYDATCAGYGLN
ncbi:MAG: hypothetical protein U0441_21135 [Polyangiaceae bacterium]